MLDTEGQKFKDVSKCHTVNIVICKKLREWLITDTFNRVHTTERLGNSTSFTAQKWRDMWKRAAHDFWLNPSTQISLYFVSETKGYWDWITDSFIPWTPSKQNCTFYYQQNALNRPPCTLVNSHQLEAQIDKIIRIIHMKLSNQALAMSYNTIHWLSETHEWSKMILIFRSQQCLFLHQCQTNQ